LRSDLLAAVEVQAANDLLIAVGDQTSHVIHRINNIIGAMKFRITELQSMLKEGTLQPDVFLEESLQALRMQAERALRLPKDVSQLLNQERSKVDVNAVTHAVLEKLTELPDSIEIRLKLADDIPLLSL